MKVLKKSLFCIGLILFISSISTAQQYTLRDQTEITYQAQLTLNMYKDLLNVISYADLATESEIQELIKNSYSNSRTQIFYSEDAIIEDDIKPSNLVSRQEQDKNIRDYLKYFDLAYEKSDQETISFYDFQTSNLKFRNYLYIKVKYTSSFKGRHKEDATAYKPVDRLAELRVEKKGKAWKTFISSIVYYDSAKPVDSTEGDLELDISIRDDGAFSQLINKLNSQNSTALQATQAGGISVANKEQDYLFNYLLELGESAFAAERYDDALLAFSEARQIYPDHQELEKRLVELGQARDALANTAENGFEDIMLNAERAYAARNYVKAKGLYSEALRLNPEEKSLKEVIDKLEKIIQKTTLFESKYNVGEYKEAIRDYTRAIKEDKENADLYYGRGKSYEKIGSLKEAFRDYSTAIELDGNFIQALNSRAKLNTQSGKLHEAVVDYTLIISNPDYAPSFYPERAEVRKMLGDYSGAIEDYNAAIELSPETAGNYFEKGVLLNIENRREEAISALSETISRNRSHKNAYYQRGLAFAALKQLPEAAADFKRARELRLDQDQIAELYQLSFPYYAKGEDQMAQSKYEEASKEFDNALLISPAFGRAWLRNGDAHFRLQDYNNAILNYDNAIKYDSLSLAYFRRGQAYQYNQDSLLAHKDFSKYISIGMQVVERAEEGGGRKKSSDAVPTTFVEEVADAWYALGYAQLMMQQTDEALRNLYNAIKARKYFPQAYYARGAAFYAIEDYKRAVKDLEESIKQGFSEPVVFYDLGKAYQLNGQLKDAVLSYSHTLKLDPEYEAAYFGRAICYQELKEYKLALEDVKSLLLLNKELEKDGALLARKGILELYQQNYQEANRSLDQALRLEDSNPMALYGKAAALARENKLEESLKLYSKAFQTRQFVWSDIKNDPLITPVKKQKAFKELVKAYL